MSSESSRSISVLMAMLSILLVITFGGGTLAEGTTMEVESRLFVLGEDLDTGAGLNGGHSDGVADTVNGFDVTLLHLELLSPS